MTDEEILRKKLDRLNENSYYGIMIDTEITNIVRSHIKRLEEATMHADCEFCIKRDICTRDVPKPCNYRYTEDERRADQASDRFGAILNGTYLHPTFRKKKEDNEMKATSTEVFHDIIAIDFELQTFPDPNTQDKFIVSATNRDDIFAFEFEGPHIVDACRKTGLFAGLEKDQKIRELEKELGEWKKEAADCLKLRDEVRREKNKEINKLKQLLQQVEHDKKRLTWENEQLKQENECKCESCSAGISYAEMYRNMQDKLEKKSKLLQEKNENLKKHVQFQIDNYNDILTNNHKLREENRHLKKELALEKAANEAQHKFIREYAGKGTEVQFNYAIDDAKEVSYVIVDKDEYNKNFEKWANAQSENAPMINPSPKQIEEFCKRKIVGFNNRRYDNHILYGRILGYSENAPISTSRADILERAKECVCGHREQDYGTPESNFQLIADMWNDYLFPMLKENKDVISAMDVSMMMALLKIARIRNGGGTGDSFVDLAGYAACGGEIWHEQKVKDQN